MKNMKHFVHLILKFSVKLRTGLIHFIIITIIFNQFKPRIRELKRLGHAILGNFWSILLIMDSKRELGRARVFHLHNYCHITTENDFPAV